MWFKGCGNTILSHIVQVLKHKIRKSSSKLFSESRRGKEGIFIGCNIIHNAASEHKDQQDGIKHFFRGPQVELFDCVSD